MTGRAARVTANDHQVLFAGNGRTSIELSLEPRRVVLVEVVAKTE